MHYLKEMLQEAKKKKEKEEEGNKANNHHQKWIKELSKALAKNYFHLSLGVRITTQS